MVIKKTQHGILRMLTMSYMFYSASNFNGDISNWDTSQVKDMYGMFFKATSFNPEDQNINTKIVENVRIDEEGNEVPYTWDIGKVTNTSSMFHDASNFNGDISNWDTSNVTDMSGMFMNASVFDRNITTKQVTVNGIKYTAWDTLCNVYVCFV